MRSFASILLALSLPLHVFATHGVSLRRHADLALRPRQQQFTNERFTYYDITAGTTACGHTHSASDFVVALDASLFGNDPGNSQYCEKAITITCNGKTTTAIIDDKCPGCPYGGLDMTQGLFEFFAPIGDGVIYGSWELAGDAPAPAPTTSSTPPPPPTPTTTYVPPTTSQQSTYSPPPPSSSSSSTSTSTTSKTSSSVSSAAPSTTRQFSSSSSATQTSSGVNYNNAPASSLAQPSGTISAGDDSSINTVYQAVIDLGTLVLALHH